MEVNCPICKKATLWEKNVYRPFCSLACKQKDLGKWADEDYRIATEEGDPASSEEKKTNEDF